MTGRTRLAAALLLIGWSACRADPNVFEELSLSAVALDFPHTLSQLRRCEEQSDAPCLRLYERVQSAKARLLAPGPGAALEQTLAAVEASCGAEPSSPEGRICRGAATALSFFQLPAQGGEIRARLRGLPPASFMRVIEADAAWLQSQSPKAVWREWLQSLELSEAQLEGALATLDSEPLPESTLGNL